MKTDFHGFSLVELMIVIAIVGILTAISIPSYKNYAIKARFTEVITATQPFKLAVALALQQGIPMSELSNDHFGIPSPPNPTKNLKDLKVEKGVILAESTEMAGGSYYILTPNAEGSEWKVSGSCIEARLC